MNDCFKKRRLLCSECGSEFEPWEEVYVREGSFVCSECFRALFESLSLHELAELTGSDVVLTEDIKYPDL